MSLITIDIKSRQPIYEQIVYSVKKLVMRGIMQPDEPLPSVRTLAGELAINPNTIQKAYSELERQGIAYSLPGKGSFIVSETRKIEEDFQNEILREIASNIKRAFDAGINEAQIAELIDSIKEGRHD